MHKKALASLAAGILLLSGCSPDYSSIEGYNAVSSARTAYSELYSAHLTVTDLDSGIMQQELSFRYDEADRLIYSYYGTDGDTVYREYHDGYSYSYTDADGNWVTIKEGEDGYRGYNRIAKMSMTDAGMIFLKPESITQSTAEQDGSDLVITAVYRVEDLGELIKNQLGESGTLTEFKVIYTINTAGQCTKVEQIGKMDSGGEVKNIDYLLKIDSMNDVGKVDDPRTESDTSNSDNS